MNATAFTCPHCQRFHHRPAPMRGRFDCRTTLIQFRAIGHGTGLRIGTVTSRLRGVAARLIVRIATIPTAGLVKSP